MNAERQKVIEEALSWKGTPYHHMGRVKGAGVDCGMLLAEVFANAGLIPKLDIDYYPSDWMCHRDQEKYLGWVQKYCQEVHRIPLPGDIILYQWGRCISHGAIVIEWPKIIHAVKKHREVVLDDATRGELPARQKAVYSFWG